MFRLFYKYLILYKRATIPGIGVFFIERKPARLDFSNKVFLGPALQVSFKHDGLPDDNKLYTFISRAQKIDVTEAAERFSSFVNKLRDSLSENRSVELPGLGVLEENQEGQIFFKAAADLGSYYPPVAAERVIRQNTEHHQLVREDRRTKKQMKEARVVGSYDVSRSDDYWWIFAIALGIIGIATLVYYYIHNGSFR